MQSVVCGPKTSRRWRRWEILTLMCKPQVFVEVLRMLATYMRGDLVFGACGPDLMRLRAERGVRAGDQAAGGGAARAHGGRRGHGRPARQPVHRHAPLEGRAGGWQMPLFACPCTQKRLAVKHA